MIPIYLVVLYVLGGVLTGVASRKSIFTFADSACMLLWPLVLLVRVAIFLIEGNLFKHLD